MDPNRLARHRMQNLRLTGRPFAKPEEVVRWLGAVQSQDYGPAKWSIAARMRSTTDAALDAAYERGVILRTHVLRPTWHFVLPEDIRWMLELTAPRVRRMMSYYDARLELDAATMRTATKRIVNALGREGRMTRTELADALKRPGFEARGQRLNHIVMNAELAGAICSGGLRGKKHTYALLDERAPASTIHGDAALAELTRRYFTSHGPATVKDFAWWSSLPHVDIKRGLAMVADELERADVDGRTFWFPPGRSSAARAPRAHLLQGYDEYIVGYTDSRYLMDRSGVVAKPTATERLIYTGALVIDTQAAGHWKRTLGTDALTLDIATYRRLAPPETAALERAAADLGRFLGLAPVIRSKVIA